MKSELLEVEIDSARPANANLHFLPLRRSVRGRFELSRVCEPHAHNPSGPLAEPVPGQVIGINFKTGCGYIREPLRHADHEEMRERLAKSALRSPKRREEFATIDLPTWLHWLKRTVESGVAKIIVGELPATIEGEPKLDFIRPRRKDPRDKMLDRLASVVEEQSKQIDKLIQAVAAKK